jgi:hypothetical protein
MRTCTNSRRSITRCKVSFQQDCTPKSTFNIRQQMDTMPRLATSWSEEFTASQSWSSSENDKTQPAWEPHLWWTSHSMLISSMKGHGTCPTSQTNSCRVQRCNERAGKARHYQWPDAPHQRIILASIPKDPDFSRRKSQGHKSSGHDFLFTLALCGGPDLWKNNLL